MQRSTAGSTNTESVRAMTDERLYIDGVLVDMGTDTKITLDVKSNLFRDISKIVSNNTYTVKLPKTVRNQMVLEHTDLVQGNSDFPYLTHTARYFRNGVEVIKDGRASVLEVTDEAIEVSIVWGLFSKFSDLINKGTQLNQLESKDKILYNKKNEAADYDVAKTADYCYIGLDVWQHEDVMSYTFRTSDSQTSPDMGRPWDEMYNAGRYTPTADSGEYLPPSVRVPFVLKLIKEQCGVDFQFSGAAKDYIDTLFLPLISKKSNELTFDGGNFVATLGQVTDSNGGVVPLTVKSASSVFSETGTAQKLTVAADATMILDLRAEWQFDISTWVNPTSRGSGGDSWNVRGYHYLDIKITGGGSDDVEYKIGDVSYMGYAKVSVPTGYRGIVKHEYTAYGKIELKKGQTITIEWRTYKKALSGAKFNGGTLNATLSSDENVPAGGYYPITSNLPKVKIIDFVKFLAAITGTFPKQLETDGVVMFAPLSAIRGNMAKAVDWTRRVIPQGNENKPRSIGFKLDDYAQHNLYKWKNDKWVMGDYDGDLQIPNDTLSTERTILEFPFSASDGNNVPMYKYEVDDDSGDGSPVHSGGSRDDDDGTSTATEDEGPEYSACTDRILRLGKDANGKAVGVFDINMQEIINEEYSDVITTLQNAKIVKETMRIRDVELLEFDETRPVFLAQYGAYFAVSEIKSDANGLAEVELLKLEIND